MSIHPVYITNDIPPDFTLPEDINTVIYHNQSPFDQVTKTNIMKFIQNNNTTFTGNVTELSQKSFDRILSGSYLIVVLKTNDKIIGTIISLIFRAKFQETELLTTYTSFLCIDMNYRKQGFAQILIKAIMEEGYLLHNIQHGYYLTFHPQHEINSKISSWYRPINTDKIRSAEFTLRTFQNDTKFSKQRIFYHISKPSIIPIKADSYEKVLSIYQKGDFYLCPTKPEYESLFKCFDIYIVNNNSLFMLFPLSSVLGGRRITIAQVTMMIGDCLPHALWIANEMNYDLLHGYCNSDINPEKVTNIKGTITESELYLEYHNTRSLISNQMIPLI